ncbi:hypothetical protein [Nitrospina gracilis]|uniref:hypothetical protein n=1 Tax=Nitrospina gracilis TaxID=35801 RepID=UPI001F17DF1D|nr:hypothetical protein [Nitrospina gracilis]MCF8721343.1 hypothetical protein [Nitrospina gracilis Nb-211]
MVVECIHCGNFVQKRAGVCPVCGGGLQDRNEAGRPAETGTLLGMSWRNLRDNWRDWAAVNHTEALILKIIAGLMLVLSAVTLFLSF